MSANTNALFDASGSYDFLGFLLNIAKVVKSKVADAFVSPSERLWSEVNGLMESIASTVLAAENRAAILAATESARRAKLDARLLGLLESSAYASWAKEQEFEKMKNPQLEPKVANQHAEAFFFDIGTFSQGAAQYFKARQRVTGEESHLS